MNGRWNGIPQPKGGTHLFGKQKMGLTLPLFVIAARADETAKIPAEAGK